MMPKHRLNKYQIAFLVVGGLAAFIRVVFGAKFLMMLTPQDLGDLLSHPLTVMLALDSLLAIVSIGVWLSLDSKSVRLENVWALLIICLILGTAVGLSLYFSRRSKSEFHRKRRRHRRGREMV